MISWMQKHKKYLVITIWISAIAFVGAGTVGFGAYDFNKKSSTIAKVNDTEISISEVNQRYSNLISLYKRIYGDSFDENKAKEMGLDKEALSSVIEDYLFLSLSKDFGFWVSDNEVVKAIIFDNKFFVNGSFSKEKYENLLKSRGIKKQLYEKELKKSIQMQKLIKVFDIKASNSEAKLFDVDVEDSLEIKILDSKDINYKPSTKDLKEYWQLNKNNYTTKQSVVIKIYEIKFDNRKITDTDIDDYYNKNRSLLRDKNDKIMSLKEAREKIILQIAKKRAKQEANRKFYEFEKGKLKATKTVTLTKDSNYFNQKDIDKIFISPNGKYLKPIEKNGGYVLVKIEKKIAPRVKSFDEAKNDILDPLIKNRKNTILNDMAKKMYNNFSGRKIGYINKNRANIDGLNKKESSIFLTSLFDSKAPKGYVLVGLKVVLYKILDQRLTGLNSSNKSLADEAKKGQIYTDVLKYISKKYKVIVY